MALARSFFSSASSNLQIHGCLIHHVVYVTFDLLHATNYHATYLAKRLITIFTPPLSDSAPHIYLFTNLRMLIRAMRQYVNACDGNFSYSLDYASGGAP